MSIFQYLLSNNSLIPENPEGNIEYKLRLDFKQDKDIKKISSQMKWRLSEGKNQNYPLEYTFLTRNNKNINEYNFGDNNIKYVNSKYLELNDNNEHLKYILKNIKLYNNPFYKSSEYNMVINS